MLVHIVARALHQRPIHAFFLGLQRHDLAGHGPYRPRSIRHEIHRIQTFGERRRPHRDLALRVHHEGIAVEHQFILPADQIDEDQRYPRLAHPRARDLLFALHLFVDLVGRGVDDQQHLRAGLARLQCRLRIPDVLAHQYARLHAVDLDEGGFGAGREVALLVEHPVVRQAGLAVIGNDRAVADHDGRIENLRPAYSGYPAIKVMPRTSCFKPLERAPHLQAHAGVKQQILRRVTRHREFRHQNHVRAMLIARSDRRRHDARGVAVDIADDQIELRHDTTQLPLLTHGVPLSRFAMTVPISAGECAVVIPAASSAANLAAAASATAPSGESATSPFGTGMA